MLESYIKMRFKVLHCEAGRGMELGQNHAQLQALVLVILNILVILSVAV
jgi:hypothetical protein